MRGQVYSKVIGVLKSSQVRFFIICQLINKKRINGLLLMNGLCRCFIVKLLKI